MDELSELFNIEVNEFQKKAKVTAPSHSFNPCVCLFSLKRRSKSGARSQI